MIETWEALGSQTSQQQEPAAQHLCFWLGEQSYALPVEQVQEIRATGAWSTLPGSPHWVLGVMNLRGLVIPLYDLRLRFGVAPGSQASAVPVLIVVAAKGKLAGLVVDGVMDVTDIPAASVRPAGGGSSMEARCVAGVATLGQSVAIILDAGALMCEDGPGREQSVAVEGGERDGGNDVAMVQ